MTACAQPGCIGTIVDGYCDVCGGPAGAPPFVAAGAAASAASLAAAARTGLAAALRGSGLPSRPRDCAQPGCIGTIVDGYCDVCGGPAGAPPFIPAGAAAQQPNLAEEERPTQRIPRVQRTTQLPSAQGMAGPAAADPEEETPTQRIPRVQMTTQLSSAEETADLAAADPRAAGTENVGEEKVHPASSRQELSVAQGLPHSFDMEMMIASIRSTTRETDGEGVDAVAADSEVDVEEVDGVAAGSEVDAEKADSVASNTEKTDTTPTDTDDADTVAMPRVGAVLSGRLQPRPQLPEQQVVEPVPVQNPAAKKRLRSLALAAATLAALLIGALLFASKDGRGVIAQPDATVTATVTMPVSKPPSERSAESTDTGTGGSAIKLEDLTASARPFEAVRIQGTYRGGAGSFVRVQRWEGGKWLDFPLPTKTDQSGQFITQAEFGQPGRYWLRVLDSDSGVTSKPFVVVIKG
jgi:hypothetical protein